ncbi:hypothetical protein XAP6164_4900013 [Xanthomonas phaseoli pv. phaseoli]|nr:hypothetical protein XAP6164_4900013 [Xanthomonas phaseoli pv. phaseoli]
MKLAHGRNEVIPRCARRLHDQISSAGYVERRRAGAGRPVDDEKVVTLGRFQRLRGRGERLHGHHGFNSLGEPQAMPIDSRSLLRIEVCNLHAQSAGGRFPCKGTRQGGFPDAAFL